MGDRNDELIRGIGRQRQICTARRNGFTLKKRRAFLDALALTCNVRKSAAFAGISVSGAHWVRHRDPAFGAQWQAALEMGYDRLEALVLEHSGAGQAIEPDPERAAAAEADSMPFDFDKALRLLMFHRAARQGQRQAPKGGAPMKNMSREETNKLLLKALAAAKKRVEKAQIEEAQAQEAAHDA